MVWPVENHTNDGKQGSCESAMTDYKLVSTIKYTATIWIYIPGYQKNIKLFWETILSFEKYLCEVSN